MARVLSPDAEQEACHPSSGSPDGCTCPHRMNPNRQRNRLGRHYNGFFIPIAALYPRSLFPRLKTKGALHLLSDPRYFPRTRKDTLIENCGSSVVPNSGQVDQIRQAARRGSETRTRQLRQKGTEANFEGVGFRWSGTRFPAWERHVARLAARTDGGSTRAPRSRGCENNHGVYTSGDSR